jgi:hypothetical protein
VQFEDTICTVIVEKVSLIPIDSRFVEVCEPNSLLVSGCVPNVPVLFGAEVEGDFVRVEVDRIPANRQLRVVLTVKGIRKGMGGLRFPDRTKEQFEKNEAFIRSAY